MRSIVLGVWFVLSAVAASAQTATLQVEVRADAAVVRDADVVVAGTTYATDAQGRVTIVVSPGRVDLVVVKTGFAPASVSVDVLPNQQQPIEIELTHAATIEEHVTVSATRTDKRVEDVPMRVEVLSADDVQEAVMQAPGDVVNMLREMGGLHVASSSPSLGAASVRIQGMRGRYTRFLSDGLPLFGNQVGGLGLLQIPPIDLGQVEVIKGVASALYGAGAMGGVVNLVARRPTETSQEFLLNRSSRGETDATAYLSQPFASEWGATLVAGGHWSAQKDVDDDGWADVAEYTRADIRPRLFWDNHQGSSLFVTTGIMRERRTGGTMDGAVIAATGAPYLETLDTSRYDVGLVAQTLVANAYVVSVRASSTWQSHDHLFGDTRERDDRDTLFAEVSARRAFGRQTIVAGAAVDRDAYAPRDVPRFGYTFLAPGVFVQDDVDVNAHVSISGSVRVDHHSEYGTFASPRVSALVRSGTWATRASFGTGFFPTSALTEETEAAGLSRLTIRAPLRAETGQSVSIDVTHVHGPLSTTATVFASRIANPVFVDRTDRYTLANQAFASTNTGAELLVTFRKEPLSFTGVYDYIHAREYEETSFVDVPLTPRHAVTLLAGLEDEEVGRLVVEWFYTGRQRLEANPFRTTGRPYTSIGVLAERAFGKLRVFVNAEDLNNFRQTTFDPLLRPSRAVDGRWAVDAWTPLDGRNINGGVRVRF